MRLESVVWIFLYLAFVWVVGELFEWVQRKAEARRQLREQPPPPIHNHKSRYALAPGYRQHLPALIDYQRGRCGICGEALPDDWAQIHVDHITPRSRDGTDESDNLQAAHEVCNLRKGPRTMDELPADLFSQPVKRRSQSI